MYVMFFLLCGCLYVCNSVRALSVLNCVFMCLRVCVCISLRLCLCACMCVSAFFARDYLYLRECFCVFMCALCVRSCVARVCVCICACLYVYAFV